MTKKNSFSWINCAATALLAYFFTVPFHEFLHFLTYYVYGDKVAYFSAGAVESVGLVNIADLPTFHKIMLAGGSASIINTIIAVVLIIVLLKMKLKPTVRLFLTQLMGAQFVQGIGYFLIGGLFCAGDWGNVFSYFPDDSGLVAVMRIVLSVLGCSGILVLMFLLNHLSYHFIENNSDKADRRNVAFKLHLTVFVSGVIIGTICSLMSPAVKSGYLSLGVCMLFNLMWIPFFWAWLYTWFMVKPPKKSRFKSKLPEKPNYVLWVSAIALILIDIFVFGPGITVNGI